MYPAAGVWIWVLWLWVQERDSFGRKQLCHAHMGPVSHLMYLAMGWHTRGPQPQVMPQDAPNGGVCMDGLMLARRVAAASHTSVSRAY